MLEIEDINNIERVDILFEWRGRKRLSSEFILGLRALSDGKVDNLLEEAKPRIYT